MADENIIRFTLKDSINVTVKKVTNSTYDFELILANNNRKTFMWSSKFLEFVDRKGNIDELVLESIKEFKTICNL